MDLLDVMKYTYVVVIGGWISGSLIGIAVFVFISKSGLTKRAPDFLLVVRKIKALVSARKSG